MLTLFHTILILLVGMELGGLMTIYILLGGGDK